MERLLAEKVSPVAYGNWIEPTCQVGRNLTTILVWVPDDITRDWLENEYAAYIDQALVSVGPFKIEYTRDRTNSRIRRLGFRSVLNRCYWTDRRSGRIS
jgi:chromosomal replication initiation ATPase DnaA